MNTQNQTLDVALGPPPVTFPRDHCSSRDRHLASGASKAKLSQMLEGTEEKMKVCFPFLVFYWVLENSTQCILTIHSPPSSSEMHMPLSILTELCVLHFSHKDQFLLLNILGYVVNLLGATFIEKTDPSCPSSEELLRAPQVGVDLMPNPPHPFWDLVWFRLAYVSSMVSQLF